MKVNSIPHNRKYTGTKSSRMSDVNDRRNEPTSGSDKDVFMRDSRVNTQTVSRLIENQTKHRKGNSQNDGISSKGEIKDENLTSMSTSENEHETNTFPRTPRTGDFSQDDSVSDFDMNALEDVDLSTIARYSDDESGDIPGIPTKSIPGKENPSRRKREMKMKRKSGGKKTNPISNGELDTGKIPTQRTEREN